MSGPIRRRGFGRPLFECLEGVTKPVFRKYGIEEMRLIRDWAQIVGSSFAEHSAPHQIKYPPGKQDNATLVIHVTGSMATLLQHMEPLLIEKLTLYFGFKAITRIQMKQIPFRKEEKPTGITLPASDMADQLAALARSLQTEDA